MMEFLTTTILSGLIYDCFKVGVQSFVDLLKNELTKYICNDSEKNRLITEINTLNLNKYMPKKTIQDKLEENKNICKILSEINTNIKQISEIGINIISRDYSTITIGNITLNSGVNDKNVQ